MPGNTHTYIIKLRLMLRSVFSAEKSKLVIAFLGLGVPIISQTRPQIGILQLRRVVRASDIYNLYVKFGKAQAIPKIEVNIRTVYVNR